METVIATRQLTRRFGSRVAVDHLDLEVPRGAIFALLGDNGAGKSTTIRMLTGLLPPDSGQAEILGKDCWSHAIPLRHRVGYVPEKPKFYDWMTAGEIGRFTAAFHRAGFFARYLLLLERFGLERGAKLKSLSKGGYAKVGLALALAPDPEVLILDEPTSGLDLFTRREFLGSMVDLAGEGRTILISSHAVAEVERVASHAAFLAAGKLLLVAPLDELRKRMVRVKLRHSGVLPEMITTLGILLDQENAGRQWQGVYLDPDMAALADLAHSHGIGEFEESSLTLEEMYTSLLAQHHHAATPAPSANGASRQETRVSTRKGGEP
jgi:ABC-2 type transport system ATP-binding protein